MFALTLFLLYFTVDRFKRNLARLQHIQRFLSPVRSPLASFFSNSCITLDEDRRPSPDRHPREIPMTYYLVNTFQRTLHNIIITSHPHSIQMRAIALKLFKNLNQESKKSKNKILKRNNKRRSEQERALRHSRRYQVRILLGLRCPARNTRRGVSSPPFFKDIRGQETRQILSRRPCPSRVKSDSFRAASEFDFHQILQRRSRHAKEVHGLVSPFRIVMQ